MEIPTETCCGSDTADVRRDVCKLTTAQAVFYCPWQNYGRSNEFTYRQNMYKYWPRIFQWKKRKVIMKALTRPLRFAGTLHDQLPLDGRRATPET